jgi:hypothetical protein
MATPYPVPTSNTYMRPVKVLVVVKVALAAAVAVTKVTIGEI